MTKSEKRIVKSLYRYALISKGVKQTRRQYHIAAIYNKGKQLSLACNSTKTRPQARRYYPFFEGGVHAELAAILAANGLKGDYSDCKLYVIRVDNNGNLANSAPCEHCSKLIQKLNFKKVIHS